MNADLTFNTIVHAKQYDNEKESARQSTARGMNTPDRLIIKSTGYVSSVTKVPGNRFVIRFERHEVDAALQKIILEGYAVFGIPETAPQASVDILVATLKAGIADASLVANVLAGQK